MRDVTKYRIAAGADLLQTVQVAEVIKNRPAAHRDLLKVVPLANRETCQTLRGDVREWTPEGPGRPSFGRNGSTGGDGESDDSFWMFAVRSSSGQKRENPV